MLRQILPEEAQRAVESERVLLARVKELAERFEPGGPDAARVRELLGHIDDLFLLVVVGEVKAGKSSFINALLRADVCPEGPIPITDRVHLLTWGETESQTASEPYVVRRSLPLESLRRMCVVDTPGTNSPLRRHQEITEGFLPRADIVFFVTSIDCPLTHTELTLLGDIRRRWQKEVACILAKVDLHPEKDRPIVMEYLQGSFREHLGFTPPIFPVSSRLARDAHRSGDAALLEASGLPAVERYIVDNLTEAQKLLLKLKSPLGTTLDVLGQIESAASLRASVLEEDFSGWRTLREQVGHSGTFLAERAERHLAPVSVAFENLESRGRHFLREAFRVRNLRMLSDTARFREAFEREVVRDASAEVDARVADAAHWLGEETRALWERSLAHFQEHVAIAKYRDQVLAGTGPSFRSTRRETLDGIVEGARRTVASWSPEGECARIRQVASGGIARMLGTELIAAGLGATIAATLLPTVLGLVGLALAAAIAVGGFFLLPARRVLAVESFEAGVRAARDATLDAMRSAITAEADRAATAVLDAFAPFEEFYEARRKSLDAFRAEARALRDEVLKLRASLE